MQRYISDKEKDAAKLMMYSMEQIRAFDQNEFLQKLWNNYYPGPGLEKPDFSSVLVQIDRFISPVYGALLREDEFWEIWSSKENVWK